MRSIQPFFLALGLVLLLSAAASAQSRRSTVEVRGTVVDARQRPVVGAKVAPFWFMQDGKPVAQTVMVTDRNGVFEGEVISRYPYLVAYSDDHALAGFAPRQGEITIGMTPAVRLTGEVTSTEAGGPPGWFNSYLSIDRSPIMTYESTDGTIDVLVPRGVINYEVYDEWFTTVRGRIALTASPHTNATEVRLDTIDLPAHFLAKHVGKQLPDWHVTAARNVPLNRSQLSDFKGKWVLLEFWGFW